MLRIGGHCWSRGLRKQGSWQRRFGTVAETQKAVETELLEWTMNEGQKEAMVFLENAMRRRMRLLRL